MKIYAIEIMGQAKLTFATEEDVARLVDATSSGSRLVRIGGELINPASVARVRRSWDALPSDLTSPADAPQIESTKQLE